MYCTLDKNGNTKYTSAAEYFYNIHIDMYCVLGTTISTGDIEDLRSWWTDPELLTEIAMPDYITGAEYDAPTW